MRIKNLAYEEQLQVAALARAVWFTKMYDASIGATTVEQMDAAEREATAEFNKLVQIPEFLEVDDGPAKA